MNMEAHFPPANPLTWKIPRDWMDGDALGNYVKCRFDSQSIVKGLQGNLKSFCLFETVGLSR